MRAKGTIRRRRSEKGIALLIAIFILLLIGVVAIALMVSSNTETALAGNYRLSTGVYYAAVAGLEETRARLRSNNPNSFNNTVPGFLPSPLGVCSPVYVINPAGGETVAPWDTSSTYPDTQFAQELGSLCGALPNPSPSTPSIWNRSPLNSLSFPGPLYKWVRINGVSEQSLELDTYGYDGSIDPTLVYYDSIGGYLNDQNIGGQVLEITALAVLPNGTQKLLQYMVAPAPIALPPFLAALTLAASSSNGAIFQPTTDNSYAVKGDNEDCSGNPTTNPVVAIGVLTTGDVVSVKSNISYPLNYPGIGNGVPDVENIGNMFPPNLQTPGQLDGLAQSIAQAADVAVPPGTASYPLPTLDQSQFGSALAAAGMSSSNPVTIVVNGNLDLSGWGGTGYGLLLVTGMLNFDQDTTWNGIILVIGQGVVTNVRHGQPKLINGAVLVANTRDASGNLLANLGAASLTFSGNTQSNGIRYSSCWVQRSQPTSGYKVLSFREIAQ